MSKKNIDFDTDEVKEMLCLVTSIVLSLDRIGSSGSEDNSEEMMKSLYEYVKNWSVTADLSKIRKKLSVALEENLNDEEVFDALCMEIPYWTPDHPAKMNAMTRAKVEQEMRSIGEEYTRTRNKQ